MNFKIIKNIAWCSLLAATLGACSEEDYKLYDTTQKDSVFFEYRNDRNELTDAFDYAFNYDIADTHTVDIPVTLMGMPKDYDRTISIVRVEEGTTMKEGVNYTITDNIIPANAVAGTVHINLLRGNDPEILTTAKTLVLSIGENDDLKSVGENKFTITYSDIRPDLRPQWWTTWKALPEYSYENAQLFFEYFYRLAPEANIDVFNEIIEAYDDYFVKATDVKGPMVMYEGFLRNYVLIPLYNERPDITWQDSPLW